MSHSTEPSSGPARLLPARISLGLHIGSLEGGGGQRVVCLLANSWAEAGHNVVIYHNDHINKTFPFSMHPAVQLKRLPIALPARNRFVARVRFFRDIMVVRRTLLQAGHHVFLPFLPQPNVMGILACLGTGIPVVITELCHPDYDVLGGYWKLLRRLTYPFAAGFVVQTTDIRNWFQDKAGLTPTVIPNPVPVPEYHKVSMRTGCPKIILAASRLVYQKNIPSLVLAFSKLADKHPDWNLHIYGKGEEKPLLERIIAEHQLAGRVSLLGWTSELTKKLSEAELFVLSSRFEGMPMALAEAMAMGVACISTDCPSGPADYIDSGSNGLLVPVEDVEVLANAMDTLMSDDEYRASVGRKARALLDQFNISSIFRRWDQCLADAMEKR